MDGMKPIYTFSGIVRHGQSKGHTVGMPTANLPCRPGATLPPFGVYASRVTVEGDQTTYLGVTNVGFRPSVDRDGAPTVETLLLQFDGDLYGRRIEVALYRFLRPTVRMDSLEAVRQRVLLDAEEAKRLLGDD